MPCHDVIKKSCIFFKVFLVICVLGGCASPQYVPAFLEGTSKENIAMIVGGYEEYGSRPDLTKIIFEIDGVALVDEYRGFPNDVYIKPGNHVVKYWINMPKERNAGPGGLLCVSDEICFTLKNSSSFPFDRKPRTCSLSFEAGKKYGKRDLETILTVAGCPVIGELQ